MPAGDKRTSLFCGGISGNEKELLMMVSAGANVIKLFLSVIYKFS